MLLTNVLFITLFMDIYALEVVWPVNETIIHRVMDFGPNYGDRGIC